MHASGEGPGPIVALVVRAWEEPDVAASLTRLVTTGLQHPEVMEAFREYLEKEIVGRLVEHLGGAGARDRATATLTVVIGVVFGRHVIGVEPLRSIPPERLVALLAPGLRAATSPRTSPRGPRPAAGEPQA